MSRFRYGRAVHFYETDLMKIVHHANYLRFAEEARVDWAFQKGLLSPQNAEEASQLAVLKTAVHHARPLRFGDEFEVELQVQRQGIRIVFEYKIWKSLGPELVAEVRSEHVNMSADGRPGKPSPALRALTEKELWTETWLSNL